MLRNPLDFASCELDYQLVEKFVETHSYYMEVCIETISCSLSFTWRLLDADKEANSAG